MTKSNPDDPSSTPSSAGVPITPANFCAHCGFALRGDAVAQRGKLVSFGPADVAFCCNCGAALDAAGKCPNHGNCKFFGFTPHCS